MAIEQKRRSLHCGLQAGLNFKQISDDTWGIALDDVPFELEKIVERWILALPEDMRSTVLVTKNGAPEAMSELGWSGFVSWMMCALSEAQREANFPERARAGVHTD